MKKLEEGFLESVKKFPEKNALWVKGNYYSYRELYEKAYYLAVILSENTCQRCVIYTGRTLTAYVGILASLLAGKTYVPMNSRVPHERNISMLDTVDGNFMIVDEESLPLAKELLQGYSKKVELLLPHFESKPKFDETITKDNNSIAYFLFTSGSTGLPKCVPVTHESITHYVDFFVERTKPNEQDRFFHMTELTFDVSVHDCFPAWSVGACVYSFSSDYFLGLANFVTHHELTFWCSVPSMAMLLNNLRKLQPGQFSTLRYSMFCGEAFPEHMARLWKKIAPNSIIENFYGPTEAAVCCVGYTWLENNQREINETVPIGLPFKDIEIMLIDHAGNPVLEGDAGELLINGSQVADGYWKNEALTQRAFIAKPNKEGELKKWYRTGDWVIMHSIDGLLYRGRSDDQIQIRGTRVEKMEIESAIKKAANTEFAAVIPWPCAEDGTVFGVIAYIAESKEEKNTILLKCRKKFPDYMVPSEIHYVEKLPYNMNGKLDYKALKNWRENHEKQKI